MPESLKRGNFQEKNSGEGRVGRQVFRNNAKKIRGVHRKEEGAGTAKNTGNLPSSLESERRGKMKPSSKKRKSF